MVRCSQSIQYISLEDYERNILTEQDVTNVEATYDFNVALLNQLHSDIEELNTAVKMCVVDSYFRTTKVECTGR